MGNQTFYCSSLTFIILLGLQMKTMTTVVGQYNRTGHRWEGVTPPVRHSYTTGEPREAVLPASSS